MDYFNTVDTTTHKLVAKHDFVSGFSYVSPTEMDVFFADGRTERHPRSDEASIITRIKNQIVNSSESILKSVNVNEQKSAEKVGKITGKAFVVTGIFTVLGATLLPVLTSFTGAIAVGSGIISAFSKARAKTYENKRKVSIKENKDNEFLKVNNLAFNHEYIMNWANRFKAAAGIPTFSLRYGGLHGVSLADANAQITSADNAWSAHPSLR